MLVRIWTIGMTWHCWSIFVAFYHKHASPCLVPTVAGRCDNKGLHWPHSNLCTHVDTDGLRRTDKPYSICLHRLIQGHESTDRKCVVRQTGSAINRHQNWGNIDLTWQLCPSGNSVQASHMLHVSFQLHKTWLGKVTRTS